MSGKNATCWRLFLAGWLLCGLSAWSGCTSRTLEWSSAAGAADVLKAGRKVAVAANAGPAVNPTVVELVRRGYTVTLLEGDKAEVKIKPDESATGGLSEAEKEKMALRMPRLTPGESGPTRYVEAARQAGADLLAEVATHPPPQIAMVFIFGGSVRFDERIREAALRISDARANTVVGMVQIRYESAQRLGIDIVKDAFAGFDLIRQGRASGTVRLTGEPGELPPGGP
jgi:hypothetical protein